MAIANWQRFRRRSLARGDARSNLRHRLLLRDSKSRGLRNCGIISRVTFPMFFFLPFFLSFFLSFFLGLPLATARSCGCVSRRAKLAVIRRPVYPNRTNYTTTFAVPPASVNGPRDKGCTGVQTSGMYSLLEIPLYKYTPRPRRRAVLTRRGNRSIAITTASSRLIPLQMHFSHFYHAVCRAAREAS